MVLFFSPIYIITLEREEEGKKEGKHKSTHIQTSQNAQHHKKQKQKHYNQCQQ